LTITVDPIEVPDTDVDTEMQSLRARFGTLTGVERAAQTGDFVSIDLSATVDGEEVPEAATEGLSHEVGSSTLVEGLDDAIVGLAEGESRVFTTTLAAGEHSGQSAQVTVTVKSVKERELPELDDEFAQLASEFDTIDELRSSLEDQVRRVKRIQKAEQIRDKALEQVLEQVDVPLPEAVVQAQVDQTLHSALHELDHDEERFAQALEEQGSSREQFDADARQNAEKAVKTELLVDTSDWCCNRVSMASSRSSSCSSCKRTTSCPRCSPMCAAARRSRLSSAEQRSRTPTATSSTPTNSSARARRKSRRNRLTKKPTKKPTKQPSAKTNNAVSEPARRRECGTRRVG
jgi:Bacterial trigger factor protein (TF) C-terminus/FKBP-type peptidyl-prolyl cis-trans isomerase